jgi:hypothetical protein
MSKKHKYDGGQVVFYNGPKPNDRTSTGSNDNQTGWGFYGIECGLIYCNDPALKTWWTLRISLWLPAAKPNGFKTGG